MSEIDALLAELARPIVFVDLETTGGNATDDRITEIGLVEISCAGVSTWSTLVDPQQPIPGFIERLTGITGAMVRGAPTFASLAAELAQRLDGRLFAAHNARFDYGFLKSEFRRAGVTFSADVLCTVRLSRALFPAEKRHGLDALIERHGLLPSGRHRALSDADLLWQFWQKLTRLRPREAIDAAVAQLVQSFSLPAAVDEAMLDDLPETPGVYVFYGERDTALYVGKTANLKQRVGAHFRREARPARDLKFAQQVRRIESYETGGELGAALREAHLIQALQPLHNKLGKRGQTLCAWRMAEDADAPRLVHARDYDFAAEPALYGLYLSRREAQQALHQLAAQHGLCRVRLGLGLGPEKTGTVGAPCAAYGLGACQERCVAEGGESIRAHASRTRAALQPSRITPWPYPGPIALSDAARHPARGGRAPAPVWHLVERWCYLGSARTREEIAGVLAQRTLPPRFEAHTYLLLQRHLEDGSLLIEPLPAVL
jgi:DNA polymerase III subunit epsilon